MHRFLLNPFPIPGDAVTASPCGRRDGVSLRGDAVTATFRALRERFRSRGCTFAITGQHFLGTFRALRERF